MNDQTIETQIARLQTEWELETLTGIFIIYKFSYEKVQNTMADNIQVLGLCESSAWISINF